MLVVGLTGGISSGKSTVGRMFRLAGVPVICTDELAHEVVEPGCPALEDIRQVFGSGVLDDQGRLDRGEVGRLVFQDHAKRKILESIVHPRVWDEVNRRMAEFESQGHSLVVVDVPLLYEVAWDDGFDAIIVVYTPRDVQEERLARRDNLSPDEIRSRISAQLPIEDKKRKADFVVNNVGSIDSTRIQVEHILNELRRMADFKKPAHLRSVIPGKT